MAYTPTLADIPQSQGYTPTLADIPGATNNDQNSSVLYELAHNPVTNFVLGAGDAVNNGAIDALNLLPKVNIKPIQNASGTAYNLGDIAGNTATFLAGGEGLEAARAASEGLPLLGNAANLMGTSRTAGVAGRLAGSAGYSALTNPNDRGTAALEGLALGGVAEPLNVFSGANGITGMLARTTARGLGGAGIGAVLDPNNPMTGAGLGAVAAAAGVPAIGAAKIALSPAARSALALKYLNSQAARGSALSPELTAQNVAMNYTNPDGSLMPVDIGKAANQGTLQGLYSLTKYTPFSGTAQKINQVVNQSSAKSVYDAQTALDSATQTRDQQQAQLEALKNQTPVPANAPPELANEINIRNQKQTVLDALQQNNPTDVFQPQQDALNAQIANYDAHLGSIPDYVNSQANGVTDRTAINQSQKADLQQAYKNTENVSKQLYAPINNANITFTRASVSPFLPKGLQNSDVDLFPNYRQAAQNLINQSDSFRNVFGDDADMNGKLSDALSDAQTLVDKGQNYGISLQQAVKKIQGLGQLAAAVPAGRNNALVSSLLNLRDGLSADLDNNLKATGNENIATQLQTANDYYKNNRIPFYKDSTIRNTAVYNNSLPDKDELARRLFDPDNEAVFSQLPQQTKQTALYQYLTGGRGTTEGNILPSVNAQDISNKWNTLSSDAKSMIAKYLPDQASTLENLPNVFNQKSALQQQLSDLQDNTAILQKAHDKNITGLSKEIDQHDSNIQKMQTAAQKNQNLTQKNYGKNVASLSKQLDKSNSMLENLRSNLSSAQQKQFTTNQSPSATYTKALTGLKAALVGGGALLSGYDPILGLLGAGALSVPIGAARMASNTLTNPALLKSYMNRASIPMDYRGAALGAIPNLTAKAIIANAAQQGAQ